MLKELEGLFRTLDRILELRRHLVHHSQDAFRDREFSIRKQLAEELGRRDRYAVHVADQMGLDEASRLSQLPRHLNGPQRVRLERLIEDNRRVSQQLCVVACRRAAQREQRRETLRTLLRA